MVLEDERDLEKFKQWAKTGRSRGAQFWLQINHPGRQMQANLGQDTWAPSAIALDLGNLSKRFTTPRSMTPEKIEEVVRQFVTTAQLAEKSCFTGVEIHAAHGYLLSQFLSPLTNQRTDAWGGSLENRARLLLDSADFQRGGFSTDDAKQVVQLLNGLGVDLVELSGGSYEAPAMQGQARDGRTLAREAYFVEFAHEIRRVAEMPVMVTGGIRRATVASEVIQQGIEMVGIATALAIAPQLPNDWRAGKSTAPALPPIQWKNKVMASLANIAAVKYQLRKLSEGKAPSPSVSPLRTLILQQIDTARRTRRYRKRMARLTDAR